MKRRSFIAKEWLKEKRSPIMAPLVKQEVSQARPEALPAFSPRGLAPGIELDFKPNQYLDLEWLSENLAPKASYHFTQTLSLLAKDVQTQILSSRDFPTKIKNHLYEEFISFAAAKNLNTHLDSPEIFWRELSNDESPYSSHLSLFIEELSFKISLIYLLKVRFLRVLSVYHKDNFLPKELLSLHSLFLRYFKRNSSREFDGSFLNSNQYSWYTPNLRCLESIQDFFENCVELSYVDIVSSFDGNVSGMNLKSHAISHKNTGLFLNCLLLNSFQWLERNKVKYDFCNYDSSSLKVVSCRFSGDYIVDHSCAHWLAQHNNSYFKWNELICPEFASDDRYKSRFVNYINEIEYYTFLVKISSFYSESPLEFISFCSKEFNSNRREDYQVQKNFILEGVSEPALSYDRLVVSQIGTPAKNAHHSLVNKINESLPLLKENGYMIVLSSTNLFVHSQKNRVNSLLKKVTLESVIHFQDVSSKGELPSYVFLFSKKPKVINQHSTDFSKKETCYNFRFSGKLDCFKNFSMVTDQLNEFFSKHLTETPSFYRQDFGKGFQLELYQDAIVDGKFIHSTSEKNEQITHPSFFKKMLQNCMPLSYFFEIHSIDVEKLIQGTEKHDSQLNFEDEFSNINQFGSDQLVLIVNFSDINNYTLELCSFDLLSGKAFQYGLSSCYYYRVVPKSRTLNANIFREFFKSEVGKQLAQMSLSGSYHQVRSKVSTMLVPKTFSFHSELPAHLKECFKFLTISDQDLNQQDLKSVYKQLANSQSLLISLANQYPYDIISNLTNFKTVVSNGLFYKGVREEVLDFNSETIKKQLLACDLVPFYPNNKDLFFEFHGEHRELPGPLDRVILKKDNSEAVVEFYNSEKLILSVHCSFALGSFLNYLLAQMKGYPIIEILKNLKIPRDEMLSKIVEGFNDRSSGLSDLFKVSEQTLNLIFKNSLVSKES